MWRVTADWRDSKGLLGIDYITFRADLPVKTEIEE
jgi:hypothetical protein